VESKGTAGENDLSIPAATGIHAGHSGKNGIQERVEVVTGGGLRTGAQSLTDFYAVLGRKSYSRGKVRKKILAGSESFSPDIALSRKAYLPAGDRWRFFTIQR
jgi:hypothetical protein